VGGLGAAKHSLLITKVILKPYGVAA
jgi:hypothetical protein